MQFFYIHTPYYEYNYSQAGKCSLRSWGSRFSVPYFHGAPRLQLQVRNSLCLLCGIRHCYLIYDCYSLLHGAVFEDKVALSYFELLDYDPRELLSQHERIRRGAPDISTIRFSFYAFNRYLQSRS